MGCGIIIHAQHTAVDLSDGVLVNAGLGKDLGGHSEGKRAIAGHSNLTGQGVTNLGVAAVRDRHEAEGDIAGQGRTGHVLNALNGDSQRLQGIGVGHGYGRDRSGRALGYGNALGIIGGCPAGQGGSILCHRNDHASRQALNRQGLAVLNGHRRLALFKHHALAGAVPVQHISTAEQAGRLGQVDGKGLGLIAACGNRLGDDHITQIYLVHRSVGGDYRIVFHFNGSAVGNCDLARFRLRTGAAALCVRADLNLEGDHLGCAGGHVFKGPGEHTVGIDAAVVRRAFHIGSTCRDHVLNSHIRRHWLAVGIGGVVCNTDVVSKHIAHFIAILAVNVRTVDPGDCLAIGRIIGGVGLDRRAVADPYCSGVADAVGSHVQAQGRLGHCHLKGNVPGSIGGHIL